MRIVVCVKQVPNTVEVRIDPVRNTLIRDGVPSILNPDDACALEMALRLKDQHPDTHITVVTMGPPQAKEVLIECLAMNADEAVLLSDRALGGSDTWATSNALAAGIRKLGKFDLIFAGRQAIDGDTAQVGPQIAEKLGVPQATYAVQADLVKDRMHVRRKTESGYQTLSLPLPCLITAMSQALKPRYMSVPGIFRACSQTITTLNANDIQVDSSQVGLSASPTKVFRSFAPAPKKGGVILDGAAPEQAAASLMEHLRQNHIV